jgi:hypothetical protein
MGHFNCIWCDKVFGGGAENPSGSLFCPTCLKVIAQAQRALSRLVRAYETKKKP